MGNTHAQGDAPFCCDHLMKQKCPHNGSIINDGWICNDNHPPDQCPSKRGAQLPRALNPRAPPPLPELQLSPNTFVPESITSDRRETPQMHPAMDRRDDRDHPRAGSPARRGAMPTTSAGGVGTGQKDDPGGTSPMGCDFEAVPARFPKSRVALGGVEAPA